MTGFIPFGLWKPLAAGTVEFIETTSVVESAGSNTASGSIAINGTGPNRKLVCAAAYDSGSGRTISSWTYNGVNVSIVQENTPSSTGSAIGYIDEADLPDDEVGHTFDITYSGTCQQIMIAATLYRNVSSGAPTDSGTNTAGAGAASIGLTGLTAGALAVGVVSSDIPTTYTWDNSENERLDTSGAEATATLSIGDIVGTAGSSQTIGCTPADGRSDLCAAAWNVA